jgi:two-component system nitrogen regulation sensor histidine kinase NtrY
LKNIFKNKLFFPVIAVILFGFAHLLYDSNNNVKTITISDFEKTLHEKEQKLNEEMLGLAKAAEKQSYQELFSNYNTRYKNLLTEDGIALLIYENDTLKFWSDNSIAVENWIREVCLDTKIAKLKNGWFEVMHPYTNANTTKTVVGLVLIKNEYPYQNKYLSNEFQKAFTVPAETKLITTPITGAIDIRNQNDNYLFSLVLNPANNTVSTNTYLAVLLNLIAFLFLIIGTKRLCSALEKSIGKKYAAAIYLMLVVALRYTTIRLGIPSSFYSLEIFGPTIFADAGSIWLSSLGDLLINAVLLFHLTFFIYDNFDAHSLISTIKRKTIIAFLLILAFFWFSWIINELIVGLIKNSNIPFSVNNLFTLNWYSLIAIIIVSLLLFVYFLFTHKFVLMIKETNFTPQKSVILFLSAASIHIAVSHFLGILDLIVILWPLVLIILLYAFKQKQFSFSMVVFLVFLFSIFTVHVFLKHTEIKETESLKILAEKLSAEQDPVAELLFSDVEKKITSDTVLMGYLNTPEKQLSDYEKRIKQQYFSGFWDKYEVHIALFDSMCVPTIKTPIAHFDNNFYFDELIANKGETTLSPNLFFIKNPSGKINYIAKLTSFKSYKDNSKFGTLYIELSAKFISDEIGFPELLLDKNIGLSKDINNYAYAKYKNGVLISQYGKLTYGYTPLDYENTQELFSFLIKDDYKHLVYTPDENTKIILSKRYTGVIEKATTFSYLFTFFSLLLLFILFIRQMVLRKIIENISFKNRIQALLVLIVLISLALFGGGTIYYIQQQFETKNRENISEKTHSVLMELESKFENEKVLSPDFVEYTTFVLKKISTVFFTDINIYDIHGNLYASSRSKVFDEGLTSKKMNPEAYAEIAISKKTEFIHDERIGKLKYLSSYIPFKNKDGMPLAYVNIPYFAKQSELEKEISGFLVALINIYVLLFALSIITAILISNYVTKPLKLIQDKLSNIKLGKTNEPIAWHEKDEIGNLVSEYNRMIAELSKSAELLAKSERESAWREMAKQVAHEIKNPLTPMKLSVQHLQRAYKDDAPDMDQKMERLTQNIIEQIDTLSSIATEFSNFAKMPKANLECINLSDTILNTVNLFKTADDTEIIFQNNSDENACVMADKEQLIRVFNNLIKNATQAIPEHKKGLIKITIEKENENYLVSVADNGDGISDDVVDKIFAPNFTTKTGGMGLGLAMVKNILESCGGRIWFKTELNTGTTFYISLPCYKN